jgi:putative solute:sodium symporter small subunit
MRPSIDRDDAVMGHTQEIDAMQWTERHRRYWRKNLKITAILLAIWFARDLSFTFFGWPFSFWVGAQGAPLAYVIIVAYYAHHMERLDRQHGVAEQENDPE